MTLSHSILSPPQSYTVTSIAWVLIICNTINKKYILDYRSILYWLYTFQTMSIFFFLNILRIWYRHRVSFQQTSGFTENSPSSESLSFIKEYLFDLASAKIPCIGSDILFLYHKVTNRNQCASYCMLFTRH